MECPGRICPILGNISKSSESLSVDVTYTSRHFFRRGRARLVAAPSENISQQALIELSERVASQTPDNAEAGLVACIRQASDSVSEVGKDCMSVILLPPALNEGRVR